MASYKIKAPKHIDSFLNFVQKNDFKSVEGFLDAYPEVSNDLCADGLQPIFFCIRNKSDESFILLLKKMNLNEDLIKKIYKEILNKGTPYMLNSFIEHFGIDKEDDCLNDKAKQMLNELNKNKSNNFI